MIPRAPHRYSEEGSALTTVLVFVVVVSILVGMILLVQALQHRLVRGDAHELQAQYGAEAGVYRALSDLDGELRGMQATYAVEGVDRCSVWVEPFGGFARIHARATVQEAEARLLAVAGERPPSAFDAAVILGDSRSRLTVTGTTTIEGDIVTGDRGLETSDFRGEPFTGTVEGDLHRRSDVSLPAYDTSAYDRTLRRAEQLLESPPVGSNGRQPSKGLGTGRNGEQEFLYARPTTPLSTTGRQVRSVAGSLTLTDDDSEFLRDPVLVVATDTLTIRGSFSVTHGSVFLAGETLSINGNVDGRGAIFYGQDTLRVGASVGVEGQFLSNSFVSVGGNAHLPYPSILYVEGPGGAIRITDQAQVDGFVLYPSQPSREAESRAVKITEQARVRGAIYNRAQAELWGTVYGTVLTHQFGFYQSPTHYVNWLKDATIQRAARPGDYVVAYGFEEAARPTVLRWREPPSQFGESDASPRSVSRSE